jgi:hypothetical protein
VGSYSRCLTPIDFFPMPDHVHWQSLHQNHIFKVLNRYLQSAIALCLILRFTLRYCLPLHIERCICSHALERMDVQNPH